MERHREVSVKGFTVLTKTAKVERIRVTCSCGQTFDGDDRLAAWAALEAHQRAQGTPPQRG